jgi:hypothetical protein
LSACLSESESPGKRELQKAPGDKPITQIE